MVLKCTRRIWQNNQIADSNYILGEPLSYFILAILSKVWESLTLSKKIICKNHKVVVDHLSKLPMAFWLNTYGIKEQAEGLLGVR
jgi:hypothetical protein